MPMQIDIRRLRRRMGQVVNLIESIETTPGPTGPVGPTGAAGANGSNGADGSPGTTFQSTRAQTDADGLYTWIFPTPFAGGVVPHVWGIAEGPNPVAGVLVNAQVEGPPTNTLARIRVTKTNASVVALLGLTILSVPASVGATFVHVFAKAP